MNVRVKGKTPTNRVYYFYTTEIECAWCKKKVQKRVGHIKESNKIGRKMFCSRKCFGFSHRVESFPEKVEKIQCGRCSEEKPAAKFDIQYSRWHRRVCKDCRRREKRKTSSPKLNPNETFVIIEGTDGLYKIGNFGTVISYTSDKIDRVHYQVIKHHKDKKGYLFVYFGSSRYRKVKKVHRLVAIHFIPNPLNKPQVNHIDANKNNPRHDNLEWCTQSENMRHAHAMNLRNLPKGINHHKNKLSEEQVLNIFCSNQNSKQLSTKFSVSTSTINNIRIGKIWSHLTNKIYQQKYKL